MTTTDATTRDEHATCPAALRDMAARAGSDVTVSTEPPIAAGPFEAGQFTCPHGVTYWVEPTGEQISAWTAMEVTR